MIPNLRKWKRLKGPGGLTKFAMEHEHGQYMISVNDPYVRPVQWLLYYYPYDRARAVRWTRLGRFFASPEEAAAVAANHDIEFHGLFDENPVSHTEWNGVWYFPTFEEARDEGKRNIRGFPAWRVVEYLRGFAIQYRPGGPYYPELEERGLFDENPKSSGYYVGHSPTFGPVVMYLSDEREKPLSWTMTWGPYKTQDIADRRARDVWRLGWRGTRGREPPPVGLFDENPSAYDTLPVFADRPITGYMDDGRVKERFLKHAANYLRAVGRSLATLGMTEQDVRINRGGVAVSGEVYGEFRSPHEDVGVFVDLSSSSVHFADRRPDRVILRAVWQARRREHTPEGPNIWIDPAFPAAELAQKLYEIQRQGVVEVRKQGAEEPGLFDE